MCSMCARPCGLRARGEAVQRLGEKWSAAAVAVGEVGAEAEDEAGAAIEGLAHCSSFAVYYGRFDWVHRYKKNTPLRAQKRKGKSTRKERKH